MTFYILASKIGHPKPCQTTLPIRSYILPLESAALGDATYVPTALSSQHPYRYIKQIQHPSLDQGHYEQQRKKSCV